MLLNKIPCLDKGYVAFVSSSNNYLLLQKMAMELFRSSDPYSLAQLGNLTLVIKCPLFVQLNLSKFDFTIVSTPTQELDAYIPNAGEIGGKDRDTNTAISDDINRTTEALLINPKAYQSDGCNRFVSQILTPINVYTTLIVQGSYNEWKRFCAQPNQPEPLMSYTGSVKQVLDMEWR